MEHSIDAVIILTLAVALVVYLLYWAANSSKLFLAVMIGSICLQTVVVFSGIYHPSKNGQPNLPLLVLPPVLLIIITFIFKRGRAIVDGLNLAKLTLVHTVALPVELMFFVLLSHHTIPKAMTLEGYNFDIFSGLTAPVVYYIVFVRKSFNRAFLIIWNLICLLLLINAATLAVLSMPGIHLIGSDQPDLAVGVYPFTLLPGLIVPVVLFAHLASLRQLFKPQASSQILNLSVK
jgi:hypothetical protein